MTHRGVNALAESIIGLYKTEVIRPRRPWRGVEAVEFATLEWVDWFNNRRLLEVIGNRPPAEAEAAYYRQAEHTALAACLKRYSLRKTRGGSSPVRPPGRRPAYRHESASRATAEADCPLR